MEWSPALVIKNDIPNNNVELYPFHNAAKKIP